MKQVISFVGLMATFFASTQSTFAAQAKSSESGKPFVFEQDRLAFLRKGEGAGPKVEKGVLRLLVDGVNNQRNAVLLKAARLKPCGKIHVLFKLRMKKGGEGGGVAFVNANLANGTVPEVKAWEAPNIEGAIGVGFDVSDPPNKDWFKGSGNFYGRPEREVSLHWDGKEIAKTLSSVEFRDGKFHDVAITIRFVIGGAYVSVRLDGKDIYADHFIPEVMPYPVQLAFGARTSERTTLFDVSDLFFSGTGSPPPAPKPVHVRVFDGVLIGPKHKTETTEVELPPLSLQTARVILTLALRKPEKGWDPWDRGASICSWNDKGEKFEIVRFITPYSREVEWKVDVTDYRSVLYGRRKMEVHIDSWVGVGFKVYVDLAYYPGKPDLVPYRVVKLWSGSPKYGDDRKPFGDFFKPKVVDIPKGATAAKLRILTTGHGQAGEFTPAKRTVIVNGVSFENTLWKTDVYLNPLRPQGGTWKFDRAGWAPGSIVDSWDVDLTKFIRPGGKLKIEYKPQPYSRKIKGDAILWTEAHVIFYTIP